jgi:stage II sporulation protein D
MDRRKLDDESDDEIAAALAAVYAFSGSHDDDNVQHDQLCPKVSPWAAASRLESVARHKFVSAAEFPGKSFTWRSSFARKWTALSIYLLLFSVVQSNSALALERIQFDPSSTNAAQPSAKSTASVDSSDSTVSMPEPSTYREPLLCPIAPAIVSEQEKLPASAQAKNAQVITTVSAKAKVPALAQSNLASAQNKLQVSLTSKMPASLPSKLTGSAQAKIPASAQSQLPASAQSQLPASAQSQLPASTQSQFPVSSPERRASSPQQNRPPQAANISMDKQAKEPASAADLSSRFAQYASCGDRTIKIAINPNASSADIIVPDGAQIIDESSQKLLAELPAQSRWQVTIENGGAGKRLSITGKLPNVSSTRLLIASGGRNYEAATYTRRFKVTGKGGFLRPPQVVESNNPKFFLPVKSPAPVLTAMKQDEYRPVAFQASPLTLTSIPKSFVPPPVVSGYIIKPSTADGVVSFDGKIYRGTLIIKPRSADSSFVLINQLALEDYLLSVVPSEMPSGWSLEALKAQSIAARSYAISNLGKHQSEGYDLKASTDDQVYLGVQSESDSSNRAVAQTNGLVLKHQGKVVTAFFHSAGGGFTEDAENVWGAKLPYLKSVPDFDDQSPHFNWNRSIPVASIEDNLKKQGRDIGGLLGIFPLERSQSQRVTSAMLAGTLQTILLSGEELRKVLGLPSTVFNIGAGPDGYLVAGRGFGHGLGMSQWGAKYLSEQGYNASQILSYYYKDVTVDQF